MARSFSVEQLADRLKPLVKGFNTTASQLVSGVAVAAGVSAIKRAMSNQDFSFFEVKRGVEGTSPGGVGWLFPAVVQDGSHVPTSVPSQQERWKVDAVQWLPPEWQTWGRKVKEEGLQHMVPENVKRTGEEFALQYQEMSRKVKSELQRLPTWDAINQELSTTQLNQRFKVWQDSIGSQLETIRGKFVTPRNQRAAMATNSAEVAATNKMLLGRLFTVLAGDGWEHVLHKDGVDVYRKRVVDLYQGGEKFYCIKAVGTINAKPEDVYDLLRDSSRVNEYNDECEHVRDLDALDADTKVTWAASKTYFPFKPRDFVTRCHNTQLNDGTYVVLTRSEDIEFEGASAYGKDFVRTEVLLAGNVMRPVAGDPSKTEFTTIAHINPGGAADTPLGAQLANKICTHGPVSFIRKLENICGGEFIASADGAQA